MGRNRPQFPHHVDEIDDYLNHIKHWPDEHQATLSTIVNQLVKQLHKLPNYSIKEIIKGGSLGKGTAMKRGSDIDLIVFFNRYNSIEDLIYDKHQIIDDIIDYFDNVNIRQFECMSFVRKDTYLIQYEIKIFNSNRSFHVDILPAMPVVDDPYSPNGLLSVYEEMESKSTDIRNHYSTCFAKVQKDMIQKKPAKIHDLICLLKNWKRRFHVPIKSYCCEVIALFVHCKCFDEEEFFDVGEAFLEAMRFLSRYKTLHIVLPFYYKVKRWEQHFPDETYILDPVNPFSDTTDRTLDQCGKDEIEKCAKKTLKILTTDNGLQSRSVSFLKEDYIKECPNTTPEKFKPEYSAINIDINPPPLEFKGKLQIIPRAKFSSEPQTIVKMPANNDDRSIANRKRRDTSVSGILRCLLIFALILLSLTFEIFLFLRLLPLLTMVSKFITTSNSDL